MFNIEDNGYNREQVDKYVAEMKRELLEYKFNVLESEKKVLDIQKRTEALDSKEKSILKALKAIEDAQKAQEEGSKNIYTLKLEQISIVYNKAIQIINELWNRHPELKNDGIVKDSLDDFTAMIEDLRKRDFLTAVNSGVSAGNDSMRILLNKMQESRRTQDQPKEVKISRMDNKPHINEAQENKFSLEEAVNPKEGLEEIMKAFDFFNED